MQAQPSRLAASGGIGAAPAAAAPAEEREAVVRELTRGHQLTARLQAEALRALRGQGQAEATATFILGEVSRAFTVCLNIMASAPAPASPSPRPDTPPDSQGAAPALPPPPPLRAREDSVPRKKILTPSPLDDGYQWRKYGQKKINNTNFPRSYYRCSYYRERRCPAQKHVQQRNGDDVPAMYVVVYIHEHTCQAALGELPDAANSSGGGAAVPGYSPAGETSPSSLRRWGAAQVLVGRPPPQLVDERAAMEERERQVLVSSLARVLQGQQCYDDESHGVVVAAVVHAPVAAPVSASSSELPVRPDHGEELDVKDYDVTDALLWGPFGGTVDSNSYGTAPDVDTLF